MTKILGIESSCDETSIAIVQNAPKPQDRILANIVRSQTELHAPFGGVVPELSSRAHIDVIDQLTAQALDEAQCTLDEIDAIAVTQGPGLIGGLMVGVMMAKGLAVATGKPLVGVNHLEGHALTVRMTHDVPFPYLLLLVSGGHCQILWVEAVGKFSLLGQTIDDALGEAFDKVAKMLGLGYPGGPVVEQRAKLGDAARFDLPFPLKSRSKCDFSFSGLKTAVYYLIQEHAKQADLDKEQFINDMCASFQTRAGDILAYKIERALEQCPKKPEHLVVAGGVAANQYLNARLQAICAKNEVVSVAPPLKMCTDNGAMIAWAGLEHFLAGNTSPLDFSPKARWPLDAKSA